MGATDAVLAMTLLVTAVAAGFDLRTGHIPNALTVGAIVLGGALHVAALCLADRPAGPAGASQLAPAVTYAVLGIAACGFVPYLLFLRGAMGGGDVKLLAAVGALLGPLQGLEVELYAFVVTALYACIRLAYDGRLLQVLGHSAALLANPLLSRARRRELAPALSCSLRFGPAVFVAASVVALLGARG